ncbi:MAG: DUF5606 domain-containing protein [Ferruginibacter sp.]
MEYRKIVSVTGMSGLFELMSSKADGGVVRSLEDKTSKFVSNRIHAFSQLEGIEIYTKDENVNLVEIFNAMKASKEKMPAANADGKEIKAYFQKVYPAMDFERVYGSDMKKMIKWYEILTKEGVEIKLSGETDEDAASSAEQPVAEKKTASKSAAATPKAAAPKAAPPKKITTPRKMS